MLRCQFFQWGKGGGLIGNWECSSLKKGQLKRERNACQSAVQVTKQNKKKGASSIDICNFVPQATSFPVLFRTFPVAKQKTNRNRKKIQLHASKARNSSLNLQFIWILQEKFTLKFLNCTIRRRRQARLRRTGDVLT